MIALRRGEVVVCVMGSGASGPDCPAHIPDDVPIVEFESETDAFAATAPADVVLIRPGCVAAPGWLEALREAAYASSTTATATALTQHDLGGALEPSEQAPFEHAAAELRAGSLRVRPRIEAPDGTCVYVRRGAIELAGAEGENFWARCREQGLAHVLADDVLVVDPGRSRPALGRQTPPQTRAIAAAQRAVRGLSAVIDARILYGPTTGTHVHVLELIGALARTERVRLTAILPDQPSDHALTRLNGLPGLSLVTYREASGGADVVHRPFQLSNAGDLTFLDALGDRLILTHQDLIAFHNPAYFAAPDAWREYRRLTRQAMATADRVVFISTHARDDAVGEELVDAAHASVVPLGVDHPPGGSPGAIAPAGATPLVADARPAMLCLGTDFHHKNRLFALRILKRLKARHGWDGVLVFAGPTVAHGSSRPQENRFLAAHQDLRGSVLDLGHVSESEKAWLFARSVLVIYPSVVEGFGLVPFEAAAHRVPCLWAPGTSLSELLPDDAAGIVPWDEDQSAAHALALMRQPGERERNLAAIGAAASGLTWDATATRLLEFYRATADAPARADVGAGIALGEDAARLVGPGGELPEDVHRPLLALATHPRIAAPVFGALKLGYRASQRLRPGLRQSQRRK